MCSPLQIGLGTPCFSCLLTSPLHAWLHSYKTSCPPLNPTWIVVAASGSWKIVFLLVRRPNSPCYLAFTYPSRSFNCRDFREFFSSCLQTINTYFQRCSGTCLTTLPPGEHGRVCGICSCPSYKSSSLPLRLGCHHGVKERCTPSTLTSGHKPARVHTAANTLFVTLRCHRFT